MKYPTAAATAACRVAFRGNGILFEAADSGAPTAFHCHVFKTFGSDATITVAPIKEGSLGKYATESTPQRIIASINSSRLLQALSAFRALPASRRYFYCGTHDDLSDGGVAEWLKAAVLKTVEPFTRFRGFESHPLRHLGWLSCPEKKPGAKDGNCGANN